MSSIFQHVHHVGGCGVLKAPMTRVNDHDRARLLFLHRISPFLVTRILANSPAGAVSIRHGLQGPNHAAATACAAGADAIGDAFKLIRSGNADVMVAGGTEACVDAVALSAFGRSATHQMHRPSYTD